MNRPIRNGRDPFGRRFELDLDALRKKWAIEDHNRNCPPGERRKSVPPSVLKLSR
mgnify:CR=1 FL=1